MFSEMRLYNAFYDITQTCLMSDLDWIEWYVYVLFV